MYRNLLDLNGTDSPFSILQGTLWPAYWTQIGPRFLGTLSAQTPKSFSSNNTSVVYPQTVGRHAETSKDGNPNVSEGSRKAVVGI
jgi:hypothetical protein